MAKTSSKQCPRFGCLVRPFAFATDHLRTDYAAVETKRAFVLAILLSCLALSLAQADGWRNREAAALAGTAESEKIFA